MSTNTYSSIVLTPNEFPESDFQSFFNIYKKLDEQFKAINEAVDDFPSGYAWQHFNTSSEFRNKLRNCNDKIETGLNKVYQLTDIDKKLTNSDVKNNTDKIMDSYDDIFEKISISFDQFINPNAPSSLLEVDNNILKQRPASLRGTDRENFCNVLVKPQALFKVAVDNSSSSNFVPKLTLKPNCIKPLAVLKDFGAESYRHPYEYELKHFEPQPEQLTKTKGRLIPKPEEINLKEVKYIENETEISYLIECLEKESEIAVDLEHNDYRSYQGITCLMQISTRVCDYVIDTLALREELVALNSIFTNPKIIKVFHGSDFDVLWLQRDFSLYVVNMFDTYQAAKLLKYSSLSLAFLLKKFCGVESDKSLQLADWRIRPLSDKMLHYAVCDTHYLLHIYHQLKNELIEKSNGSDLLYNCLQRSTDVCLKRYEKPILFEDSYVEVLTKCKKSLDNRQMCAFREIFNWRDKIARVEDESLRYVLPNHMLLHIAEALPREVQGILALCNPVPPLVHSYLLDIHRIVLKARELPLVKPILMEDDQFRSNKRSGTGLEFDLNCPLDLSNEPEFRDDLPTLFSFSNDSGEIVINENCDLSFPDMLPLEEKVAKISIFEESLKIPEVKIVLNNTFLSPYARYEKVKAFAKAKEEVEEQIKAKNTVSESESDNEDQPETGSEIISFVPEVKQEPIDNDNDRVIENVNKQPAGFTETTLKTIRKLCKKRKQKRKWQESNEEVKKEPMGEIAAFMALPRDCDEELEDPKPKRKKVAVVSGGSSGNGSSSGGFWSNVRKKFSEFKKEKPSNDNEVTNVPEDINYSNIDFNKFKGGAKISKNTKIQLNSLKKKKKNKKKNRKNN